MMIRNPSLCTISQLHDGTPSVNRPSVDHAVRPDQPFLQQSISRFFSLQMMHDTGKCCNLSLVQHHPPAYTGLFTEVYFRVSWEAESRFSFS